MARLGRIEYPELTLTDAIAVAGKMERVFGGASPRAGLARVLGLDPRGGWFAAVVASLRIWGLADGRGTQRLSRLGQRLAFPQSEAEQTELRREGTGRCLSSIGLGHLQRRELPGRAELAVLVEEASGADRATVARHLSKLERILRDALEPVDSEGMTGQGAQAAAPAAVAGPPGTMELRFSGGSISLPESVENLQLAMTLLQRRIEELRSE
ncbi:MAG: hypothetical protein HY678_11580 [Chloroflexi bacterium]|nr:hypothetical protein [Chloroflexota bacterium]